MSERQSLLPTTHPMVNDLPATLGDPLPDESAPTRNPPEQVKLKKRGIFQVAYGKPDRNTLSSTLVDIRQAAAAASRLLREIRDVAPSPVRNYLLAASWLTLAPALSLGILAVILGTVERALQSRSRESAEHPFALLTLCWLVVAVSSVYAQRKMWGNDTGLQLRGHLRAHFFPKMIKASLGLNMTTFESRKAALLLPTPIEFEWGAPGFLFFYELVLRLRNFFTVAAEVAVLALVIYFRGLEESRMLAFFAAAIPSIIWITPTNAVGGAGYVFWAEKEEYYRMENLFTLATDAGMRKTLVKDHLCSWIAEEYQKASEAVAASNVDAFCIANAFPVQWYWNLVHDMVVHYPLVFCAMFSHWSASQIIPSLITMVLVQYSSVTLRQSVLNFRDGESAGDTIPQVLRRAERLYDGLSLVNVENELSSGTAAYPDPERKQDGMKIAFRNVSFKYHFGVDEKPEFPELDEKMVEPLDQLVLRDVSFEIPPGSLVVIAGENGSGKSSLLALLAKLYHPSEGQILVDDKPIESYDEDQLRESMVCLFQNEKLYPAMSVRENMLMGVTCDNENSLLRKAALLGCASELIEKLPQQFNTVMEPVKGLGMSSVGFGYSHVSPAAVEELEKHRPAPRDISASPGEQQRLAATRMFSRLLRLGDRARLIICDEATAALDPRAERDIFRAVKELGAGKTVIIVTHRYGEIVKEADLILVMKHGVVVEHGTHDGLIGSEHSEYGKLYQAQAEALA